MSELLAQNWCLVTTYKNNLNYLDPFLSFYIQHWSIKNFYLLIGVNQDTNREALLKALYPSYNIGESEPLAQQIELPEAITQNYSIGKNLLIMDAEPRANARIKCIIYETNLRTSTDQWNALKNLLFDCLDRFIIPANFTKIINIDSDEYLFTGQIGTEKFTFDELHFHYVDFVPQESFNQADEMYWCIQPWYYRSQWAADAHNGPVHNYLAHDLCKTIYFNRSNIKQPWHHNCKSEEYAKSGRIIACKEVDRCKNNGEYERCLSIVPTCFHLSVPDRSFYELNSNWSQTDFKSVPISQDPIKLKHDFDQYYLKPVFPVVKCNIIKEYWPTHFNSINVRNSGY